MYPQQKKILNYCKEYGSITIREAFTKLHINSPGKRISEMRNSGRYKVESIVEHHTNEQGEKTRYLRYFIHELQTDKSN
jgi:hypothetical protein